MVALGVIMKKIRGVVYLMLCTMRVGVNVSCVPMVRMALWAVCFLILQRKQSKHGTAVPERRSMMELIDAVMMNVGAFVLIAGGLLLLAALTGLVVYLVGQIWTETSKRLRAILRVESLIYEYKRNREEFLRWKEEQDG